VQLGAVRWEGGAKYRYVYMEQSATTGLGVMLTSGGSGYSVTASMTTGDMCFGVVQNATLTTGTYGWVLVDGLATVKLAANSALGASKLLCVTGTNTFGDWVYYNSGATGGTLMQVVGRTLGSTTSGAAILAYIHCSNS
jgi:hypothetical protein